MGVLETHSKAAVVISSAEDYVTDILEHDEETAGAPVNGTVRDRVLAVPSSLVLPLDLLDPLLDEAKERGIKDSGFGTMTEGARSPWQQTSFFCPSR